MPDRVALGVACADLAALLVQQGRLADAEPALARAEALLERALGVEDPDVAAIRARRRTLEEC